MGELGEAGFSSNLEKSEIIFGILAHTNPHALGSLLKKLEGFQVIIHLDRGVDRATYLNSLGELHRDVVLINVENSFFVNWGGISVVDAEMAIVEEFLKLNSGNAFLVLLSGECFPVRPIEEFCDEVSRQSSDFICYMQEIRRLKAKNSSALLPRYTQFWFRDLMLFKRVKKRNSVRYRFRNLVIKVFQVTATILRFGNKIEKPVMVGSQWIVGHSNFFKDALPLYAKFRTEFKNTLAPDEMLFQTMYYRLNQHVHRLDDSQHDNPVVDARFHLIHESLNYEWQVEDINKILESGKYFVRKISPELREIFWT